MDIKEKNNQSFSKIASTFNVSYLRDCEEYLAKKYIKGKVLVLGCGAGRTLAPLKKMGIDIIGIDLNEDMVVMAKKQHRDIPIYQGDATKIKFENDSFDTVFFPFHGIDYVYPDIYEAVGEIYRVLRPNGIFIMSSHNRLYLKKLNCLFDGNWSNYGGFITYRTTMLDWFKLKKYFRKVKVIQRISISKTRNWKDFLYKIFPILNKSTYFICIK